MDTKNMNNDLMDLLLSVQRVSFGSVDEWDSPDFANAYIYHAVLHPKGEGLRDATQEEIGILNDNMEWFFDQITAYGEY